MTTTDPSAVTGRGERDGAQRRRIVMRNVWKRFGGIAAVQDLDLDIESGSITGLIGPNGAGKTTAFNVITGQLRPDSGQVELDGRDLTRLSPSAIVDLGIARSFQDVRIFVRMSVLENVLVAQPSTVGYLRQLVLPAARSGVDIDGARSLIERVGLGGLEKQLAGSLSYAQQKTLAVARLLATRARFLLLDEPTSGLDERSVETTIALLKDISGDDVGICVVEHNMEVISELCDRVAFMAEGRCLATDDPKSLMARQDLAELFFGTTA